MIMPTKPEDKKKIPVTVGLEPGDIERLDKFAARIGSSRSHSARNLLLAGLDLLEDFERFRIISFSVFLRDNYALMRESFKEWVMDWEGKKITHK